MHRSSQQRRVTHPTIMRRYDIVSLIPLILIIITFALAAPVQVQEKRQAPEDVITVLGKQTLDEDLYTMFGS